MNFYNDKLIALYNNSSCFICGSLCCVTDHETNKLYIRSCPSCDAAVQITENEYFIAFKYNGSIFEMYKMSGMVEFIKVNNIEIKISPDEIIDLLCNKNFEKLNTITNFQ